MSEIHETTQSTAVLHKCLNDELKLLCLLQFLPEVAQNSLRITRVFHVQRNPRVFQVIRACGQPADNCMGLHGTLAPGGIWCTGDRLDTTVCGLVRRGKRRTGSQHTSETQRPLCCSRLDNNTSQRCSCYNSITLVARIGLFISRVLQSL